MERVTYFALFGIVICSWVAFTFFFAQVNPKVNILARPLSQNKLQGKHTTKGTMEGVKYDEEPDARCSDVRQMFVNALWNSTTVTNECRTHASMTSTAPDVNTMNPSAALRYLLKCQRNEKLKVLAAKLCDHSDGTGSEGGQWNLEHVYRVYRDTVVDEKQKVDPVTMLKSHSKLEKCCQLFPDRGQKLVDCLRAARPSDFTNLYVTDPNLTRQFFLYAKTVGHPVGSALEMGSGKGNWMASLGRAGVETVVGIEPWYMGSLALYEDSWDVKYEAMQLDAFVGDSGIGDLQLNAFLCERFGSMSHQFDLVWSVEVFEHIPKHLHCALLNKLASMSKMWVVTSIARPGQGGIGHISSMSKLDWRGHWEERGFEIVSDDSFAAFKTARWSQFRRNAMLFKRVTQTRLVFCDV